MFSQSKNSSRRALTAASLAVAMLVGSCASESSPRGELGANQELLKSCDPAAPPASLIQIDVIVEPEKWLAVQDILAAHNNTGEKDRKHNHYLRSTIYCSICGGRLVYSEAKGNGGKYIYFMCSKKKTKVNYCQRPAVRVERIEEGILRFYEGFQVNPEAAALIQAGVEWSLETQREDAVRTTKRAKARRAAVEAERQVLLRAHYAGAVPQDLLASEMQRFTRELAEADRQLRAAQVATTDVLSTLKLALQAATRCEINYAWAPNQIRRQINRGFFKSLWIGEDGSVERYELNEPFKALLAVQGPLLGNAATAEAEPGTVPAEAVDCSDARATAERTTPSVVLQASFLENDVTDSNNNNTHRRWFSTVRGLNDAYLVGAVEALSHRSAPVQRLLDLAKTWSDTPNGAGPTVPPKAFKTLRKLKPHEVDELVERYQAGSSVYQLAKHYGIHRITIGKHLRSRGIDTTAPALTEEQVRETTQLYADGWSCKKIARHFGVGAETVRERLHQSGVMMRGPHERARHSSN